MTVLAKKQIRSIIGFSDRKTFNKHIARAGIKDKLPTWYWLRYCFYDDEIVLLEGIFNHKLILATKKTAQTGGFFG